MSQKQEVPVDNNRPHENIYYQLLAAALLGQCAAGHDAMVGELVALRERRGRLFILGVGGGAANAAHAVCDFRKLCALETYAPTDAAAEVLARANDDGWRTIFAPWLRLSRLSHRDAIMVFSVGGGQVEVSACIYEAVTLARQVNARVLSVVGRPEGAAARMADVAIVVSSGGPLLTPITEVAQIAVLHALVSDPRLQCQPTKW